ncbi:hypothetical protein [Streptomyces indicus]|uniref:Uncharacterized protein n=1 Tax=Streptomyces indicus TaxID=417292 RepID=A0A1G8U299_9ACTN|nr:hypothetical protein [Streptomyces indicus]SDJ47140.1 hypothetical protein SAMN05421806_101555 [Streptomyces indicus]
MGTLGGSGPPNGFTNTLGPPWDKPVTTAASRTRTGATATELA